MKLLIAIPALNEEESIAAVIERCLAAREAILASSPVTAVEVTVVSDGSTDATVPRARTFGDRIRLIVFERNRGYGAAILAAWQESDAELLGFLDADGTCDPLFFADLCRTVAAEQADIVLGNRLAQGTRMPRVRRFGNFLFGSLLSLLSSTRVADTASGMRVVRRSALGKLLPLPTGLHFTPAMTARAVLRADLRIREIPMPYAERVGISKLSVVRDGLRFLSAIGDAVLLYRPSRPFTLLGLASLAAAGAIMLLPVVHYLSTATVAEWMIYRFVVSHLLATTGVLWICFAHLSRKVVATSRLHARSGSVLFRAFDRLISGWPFWPVVAALGFTGAFLVAPSAAELLRTGATNEHWSRFLAMSFFLSTAAILVVTKLMNYCLWLLEERQRYFERPPRDGR